MFAKVHRLERVQELPLEVEACWEYFANPMNLPELTPPWLHFDTTGTRFTHMVPGQILQYRVAPLLGIPLTWTTEITHVRENELFVDEQRVGPYALWHHEHHFEPTGRGTRVTDRVHYALPFWPVGEIMHPLVVGRQVRTIFDYRREKLERRFGTVASDDG